jgi:hypothetical protein
MDDLVLELKFLILKYETIIERFDRNESDISLALIRGSRYVLKDLIEILKKYDV